MKYNVTATRTYYSSIDFVVNADSLEEADQKARQMIDDNIVEFTSIDNYDDEDSLEIYAGRDD